MKPSEEEHCATSSSYPGSFMIQHGVSGSMSSVRKNVAPSSPFQRRCSDSGAPLGLSRRSQPSSFNHRRNDAYHRSTTCAQRCYSRLTVVTLLVSAVILSASVATDRWMYTSEPLRWANSSIKETSYNIAFRTGLWRTCSSVNWSNATTNQRVAPHARSKCIAIPLWPTDLMSEPIWKEADFTGTFLNDMRLATPFIAAGLILLSFAVLTSLIGHCLQDISTLLAAILLILAGLTLGGGLVIYMTSMANSYAEQSYYRKSIVGVRLFYHYGLSFYGACLALVLEELAAMFAITAYLRNFRSREELFRLIPGLERARVKQLTSALRPSRTFSSSSLSSCSVPPTSTSSTATIDRKFGKKRKSGKKYIRMSKTESSLTGSSLGFKGDSRRTLKEDLTLDNLTQIECVTVAL